MENFIKFRLITDKTEGTYSLKGGTAIRDGKVKFINYRPGCDSIFDEDNKDSIVKPRTVVFKENFSSGDPAVEINVPIEDTNLIDYLKANRKYGKFYKIHNQNQLDEEISSNYDKVEEALSLIKETDDLKIQAIALAIIGIDAYGWAASKCKANLKEKAVKDPKFIINQINSNSYESKYLAALALFSGIVEEDNIKSAVVWNDAQKGIILRLAKGEKAIEKLGELLAVESDESLLILQEIGIRLNKKAGIADINVQSAQVVTGKTEAEIAEAAIEAYKATLIPAKTEEQIIAEYLAKNQGAPDSAFIPETSDKKDSVKTFDPTNLDDVHAKYKEVTGKDVPVNMKNKLEWLNAEIVKGI